MHSSLVTCFARRLVALSWSYTHLLLPDDTIAEYLDELVELCELELLGARSGEGAASERDALCDFLKGVLDVVEVGFGQWSHDEIHAALASKESALFGAFAHLTLGVAA